MWTVLFRGVFDTTTSQVISVGRFLLCLGVAAALGVLIALGYAFHTRYTKSFIVTLCMLPAIVCVVIMMVNGNIGAGVAVAGAFSLVRFRSVPGTAREIGMLFLAMGAGLVCGMGYLGYAVLFSLLLSLFGMLLTRLSESRNTHADLYRCLRITVPEDLEYEGAFDEILKAYTSGYSLVSVKTTNMGSLFRLRYELTMKTPGLEKQMIDRLRVRNGNLEISLSHRPHETEEL